MTEGAARKQAVAVVPCVGHVEDQYSQSQGGQPRQRGVGRGDPLAVRVAMGDEGNRTCYHLFDVAGFIARWAIAGPVLSRTECDVASAVHGGHHGPVPAQLLLPGGVRIRLGGPHSGQEAHVCTLQARCDGASVGLAGGGDHGPGSGLVEPLWLAATAVEPADLPVRRLLGRAAVAHQRTGQRAAAGSCQVYGARRAGGAPRGGRAQTVSAGG